MKQPDVAILEKKKRSQKGKYSFLSVFLSIILFGILTMLGERILFDLNRFLNPVIDNDYTQWKNEKESVGRYSYDDNQMKNARESFEMSYDYSGAISDTRLYYKSSDEGRYTMYKIIIHSAFAIPGFLLAFWLFYKKKNQRVLKPMLMSFFVAAFFLIFHLIGEIIDFVSNTYKNLAIYIILIILAVVFSALAYFDQYRYTKEDNVN